ncbi:hypothetical protein JOL62DRAFT_195620 [Phyllosticta paracitricarpa]|uniref:Uncharacterized protein n=1 Tax=Phyllosticta paracitricarpa TaxID=2016321 RepID=A0ABR1N3P7_9PEZI
MQKKKLILASRRRPGQGALPPWSPGWLLVHPHPDPAAPSPSSLYALRCLVRPDIHHLSLLPLPFPTQPNPPQPNPLLLQPQHSLSRPALPALPPFHTPSLCLLPSSRPLQPPAPARPISRLVFVWSSWLLVAGDCCSCHFQALTRREDHLSTPSTHQLRIQQLRRHPAAASAQTASDCALVYHVARAQDHSGEERLKSCIPRPLVATQ